MEFRSRSELIRCTHGTGGIGPRSEREIYRRPSDRAGQSADVRIPMPRQWRAYAVRVRASWRGECVCMAWLASSCFPAGSARAVAAAGSAAPAPAAAGASIGPAAIGPLTCSRLPARCRRRIRIRHPPRPKPRRHAYGALCMRAVQGDVRTYPDRSIARIIHSWFYSINHASHAITWGLGHCICIYMSRVVCVSTREAYRPDTTLQRPRRPLGNRKKNTQTGIHQTVL